nr:integrase, catalytic region, zinc finger, CCHC-type, peptidase aspartic, catalytic [Tanacetum cinerariifolium]
MLEILEGRSSYARAMIKLQDDVELKGSDVVKNLKKPSQAPRGVPIGPNVRFKPVKQVYKPKMNNVNTSGNKKKDVESTKEIERLIIDGKVTLVDDEGKPLEKVDSSSNYDSKDEVASVDNEMESFLASKKVGYGTNSLLEQWKETYEKVEYYYDQYDDDLYKGQEDPDNIQSICDKIDIKIRGSKVNTSGQEKVIKCYNCQAEGHMARQCTQPKIKRDATWFKEKVLHVQAQAKGKELDEEQLAFLADPRVADGQVAQTITHNAAFQTDDQDAYDFDCDDISSAKAFLMANLLSCDSNVLFEDLKAQLQAKDTVISKLKETILSLRENVNPAKVKKDIVEIETINIKLEHSVAKLLSENEKLHKEREQLKKTYKELYDSIKPSCVHAKEQVISSTGASGSMLTGNTKNNMILQSSSSNKTNKVEDQSRSIKSRKNKKNHVAKIECIVCVMQSMLNAISKSICDICNECLFDENHDKFVLDYVHDVNVLSKSKHAKCKSKKQIWKPTVPLKEITRKPVVTPTPGIMVYGSRPKAPKSVGSSSKSKIIGSRIVNQSKPTQTGESTVSNVPSFSLIDYRLSKLFCVKFSNDHIAKIMGYGDYQIRNVTISRVYYVEELEHNLFSIGQFYDSDLEVAFHKHTCIVHNLEGVNLLMGSQGTNLYTLSIGGISHETSVAYTPQQNDVVERRNCTLVEAVRTIKPDLSYLYVFAALCYPTNDSEDLGKLKSKADVGIFIGYAPTKKAYWIYNRCTRRIMETIPINFDELIEMASKQSSLGPALHEITLRTLSLGLVPQPLSLTPFVPPTKENLNTLLQPLFDEYFCPPPCVDHPVPEVAAPVSIVSTGLPSLTSVD